MSTINSFLQLDSSQYAQVPIGATRVATKGNGTNIYGTIPTWSATDWEVEFDVVFPTTVSGNSECLIDSSTASNRRNVLVDSGGLFQRNSAGFSGYLDGGTLYGQAQPTDGAVHHIKLVGSALSIDVTNILQNYVGSIRSRASIFNLRLTDLGTPANSRFYPMNSNTGVTTAAYELTNVWRANHTGNPYSVSRVGPGYTTLITKSTASSPGTVTNADTYNSVNVASNTSGRAFIANSMTFKAGKAYMIAARFSGVTVASATENNMCIKLTSATGLAQGITSTVVSGNGVYAIVFSFTGDKTTDFRIGTGVNTVATGNSATISDVSIYELPEFIAVNGKIPPLYSYEVNTARHLVFYTQFSNTYNSAGLVTESSTKIPLSGTRTKYALGVYVSDSFGNDPGDWPDQFSQKGITLIGGSWPGQPMSYFVTKADNVFAQSLSNPIGDAAPDFAICQSSLNSCDQGHTAGQMLTDMTTLINKAKLVGLKPFVTNMTPFGASMSDAKHTELLAYNAALPALCTSLGARLIDVYSEVVNPVDKRYLLPAYDLDGTHLNATGANVYAQKVYDSVVAARTLDASEPLPELWRPTWYNRTSGDVVTVYPDAIKPGEEFYLAIKYKVTDVSQNSGYNNPFSIGRRASGAYSSISLYLPESNGRFYVDPYNGTARTTGSGIMGKTMGATHLDGLTHVAVVRLKADGSYEFWVDATTPKYTGVPNSQLAYAMDVINLNGYANATTGAAARMGINFHYVYLYSALSAGDITALMQGANPETVGTIRQGYNLNGNGNEKNGGNPLVLYGSPEYVKERRKSKHNTVESIVCGIAYGV